MWCMTKLLNIITDLEKIESLLGVKVDFGVFNLVSIGN